MQLSVFISRGWLLSLWLCPALALQFSLVAQEKKSADFTRDVQPIFQARCILCHGSEVQMGGLRLDQRQSLLSGGKSGIPAIVTGKSAQSLLVRYISGLDPKLVMPPTGERLNAEEISLISQWIDQGAVWPDEAQSSKPADPAPTDHWAFKRVHAPVVPAVKRLGLGAKSNRQFCPCEARSQELDAFAGSLIPEPCCGGPIWM